MLKTIKKLGHIKYEVQRRIQHYVSYLIETKKQKKKLNKKEKQKQKLKWLKTCMPWKDDLIKIFFLFIKPIRVKCFKPMLPKCSPLFQLLVCSTLFNYCELIMIDPVMAVLTIMFMKTLLWYFTFFSVLF